MDLEQIDHVAIAVADVQRSIEWYRDVLGFEKRHPEWGTEPAMMCAGDTCVALFVVEANAPQPPPGRDTIAMRHLAFRADRAGFVRAQEQLRERGIEFAFMDHETAHSVYFQDPDGHRLEITTYEPPAETIYRRALDAFNRGDRQAFLEVWHEHCEYRPGLESNVEGSEAVFRGPAAIGSWWDRIHEELDELGTHLQEFYDLGDRTLGVIEFRAKGAASGAATTARVAQLATYRDGKLLTAHDYFDVDEGKRAAGL